jgi:SAM-dependent methyltransferase
MSPQVREEFRRIIGNRKVNRVLEVGATPLPDSLLTLPNIKNANFRIGVDLNGPQHNGQDSILKANAHHLPFHDCCFDLVLCNSVLEHDPGFWLTVEELKRVAMNEALIIIGVPGFSNKSTVLPIHNYPGDFYRFSEQAMKKMLDGLNEVKTVEIMNPPRIIGWGYKI